MNKDRLRGRKEISGYSRMSWQVIMREKKEWLSSQEGWRGLVLIQGADR